MDFIKTIGFSVFNDNLSKIQIKNEKAKVINTISPNSYGISTKDIEFKYALQNTDYLVLDGVYFALSSIILQGKNIKKNQGPDVFFHFMKRLNAAKGRAFFLGSTENTLLLIKKNAAKDYPNIEIDTYSPPYKVEFSDNENQLMIERINSFNPHIVFVGMTCPKQEKWAIRNKDRIKAGLIITIGNVFDWFAGNQKSIHPIWFKLRLGWLVRIFLRPEIFKRNIGNQMLFFLHVLLIFLKLKRYD